MWLEAGKIEFLDWEQREQVGYSFIIDKLQIFTPFGIEEKRDIKPYRNKQALVEELDNVEALIASIKHNRESINEIERFFCRVKDIKNTLERCKNNITLDDVELYEVKYFALLNEELLKAYKSLKVNIKSVKLNSLQNVINILDPEGKRIPTFYIYEGYSEKLKLIREEKRKLEAQICIVDGTGDIGVLRKERLKVVIQEEEEELNIRKALTEALSIHADLMVENIKSIGILDFLLAKARLSIVYNASRPNITENFKIVLEDMFNPEIAEILKGRSKAFTPITISLQKGTTVITGANMGGKSVALKTTVLNILLAQCGFFVFAQKAEMPILGFIYFISDDMQSVSQGLSTFGAEIIKLKEVIECAKQENGFIALDEFARGTNPKEGFYLVKAMCRYLNSLDSISLISTHYDNIAEKDMVHYQVAGLKYVNVENLKYKINLNILNSIDILQESMGYTLERVSENEEVPKDALNIAILLGLQSEIIESVKVFYEEGLGEKNEK